MLDGPSAESPAGTSKGQDDIQGWSVILLALLILSPLILNVIIWMNLKHADEGVAYIWRKRQAHTVIGKYKKNFI